MIITVTMNPAIDKTVEVDKLHVGAINRLLKVEIDVGGKGINVSKTISYLGGSTVASGFLAGNSGSMIENALKRYRVKSDFIYVDGETRTNLKLVESSGALTELNEPGPVVSKGDMEMLARKLQDYPCADTLFVFAGSASPGVEPEEFRKLIRLVKQKGGKVFLDADGELFAEAIKETPDIIKPNDFELSQYFGLESVADEEKLIEMGQRLVSQGINTVCVSRGSKGALILQEGRRIRVPGLNVKAHSAVGAGDAFVAAFSYGIDRGIGFEECVRLAIATSAGAVMTVGTKPPSGQTVKMLMDKVKIQYF